ncbi:MAG: hypothetical protein P8X89_21770 [Reinekea sp.]
MDKVNWPYYNAGHDYSQIHQEDAQQHAPEAGQTSRGVPTNGASWSHPAPGQPNMPIPPTPGGDLDYFLQTFQPGILDEITLPQPEAGHASAGMPERGASNSCILNKLVGHAGGLARGASGSHPAPGQPYWNLNTPAPIPPSPEGDLDYFLQTFQPSILDEITLPQYEAGQRSAGAPAREASRNYPAPGQPYWNPNTPAPIPPSPEGDLEYFLQTFQPNILDEITLPQYEAGQRSAGAPASEASRNCPAPGQPYWNPNTPEPIPPSPVENLEYFLQTFQPNILDEITLPQYEAGQMSAGAPTSEASANYPAPEHSYWNINTPESVPSSLATDLEDFLRTPPPSAAEEIIQSDALSKPQPAVKESQHKTETKEAFLAGLEAFAMGTPLKDCSSSIRFYDYIKSNGELHRSGIPLYKNLTAAEKELLDEAIIARQGGKLMPSVDIDTVKESFLAGLDNYAQGVALDECSTTLPFKVYVSSTGNLKKPQ